MAKAIVFEKDSLKENERNKKRGFLLLLIRDLRS